MLIPFCGFDSLAADMAVWLAAQELHAVHGQQTAKTYTAIGPAKGSVSKGTMASVLEIFGPPQEERSVAFHPYALNPPEATAGTWWFLWVASVWLESEHVSLLRRIASICR